MTEQLATAGLDLVHAFDAHAIGERARADAILEEQDARTPAEPTTTTNRDGTTRMVLAKPSRPLAKWTRLADGPRLGLLVGNTRALWLPFVAARHSLPHTDPLEAYVERTIDEVVTSSHTEAVRTHASDVATANHASAATGTTVLYSHQRYDAMFLPFQHLAVATGFAAMNAAGLAIHPTYGPWFALRAVITVEPSAELAIPALLAPIAKPCTCTGACEAALVKARGDLRDWRAWLAVRDACTLRDHRYSDEQIRFHYASAWPKAARRDDGSGQ